MKWKIYKTFQKLMISFFIYMYIFMNPLKLDEYIKLKLSLNNWELILFKLSILYFIYILVNRIISFIDLGYTKIEMILREKLNRKNKNTLKYIIENLKYHFYYFIFYFFILMISHIIFKNIISKDIILLYIIFIIASHIKKFLFNLNKPKNP